MNCPLCAFALSLRPQRKLRCGHVFHEHCVARWLAALDDACPVCKQYDEVPDRVLEHRERQRAAREDANKRKQRRRRAQEREWCNNAA